MSRASAGGMRLALSSRASGAGAERQATPPPKWTDRARGSGTLTRGTEVTGGTVSGAIDSGDSARTWGANSQPPNRSSGRGPKGLWGEDVCDHRPVERRDGNINDARL